MRNDLRTSGAFTADSVGVLAGCSPATFYTHFGTKDDALAAAFEQTLAELVAGSVAHLEVEQFTQHGVDHTVSAFVEWQAQFFRLESLVFRAALSRLPDHQPIRAAYRVAEQATLDHLEAVFTELGRAGLIAAGDPTAKAEAFMVAAQGINNPRALRPSALPVRAALAEVMARLLAPGR